MRRLFVLTVAVVAGLSSMAFAAFTRVGTLSTYTASATTSGGTVSMSVSLSAGTSLTWSSVTPGQTHWKVADNYISIHSTITNATGGIQVYTDNVSIGFSGTGTANPAGLVDATNTTQTLPMCWRIVDVSTTSLTIMQGANAHNAQGVLTWYPDRLYSNEIGVEYPCFLWMKDLNTKTIAGTTTTAFVPGDDYCTMKNAYGIQHAEATWGKTPSPDCIYLGADFSNALGSRTYNAKVCIEAFTE
jgi:hypothetical protein